MTSLKILIIVAILFPSSASLFAADPNEAHVLVQFVSFPRAKNPQPLEIFLGDEKTLEIEAPTNSVSRIYKIKRKKHWKLGKSQVDADGNFSFQEYGQVPCLASNKQLILVLRKGKSDADGLTLIPISAASEEFGGGKYFIMNASVVDIAGIIGGEKFILRPQSNKIISPVAFKKKGNLKTTDVRIFFSKDRKPKPFFSSVWRLNDNARNLVFIYNEPKNQKLKLHIIRNYIK
jgi:hypothetical protein